MLMRAFVTVVGGVALAGVSSISADGVTAAVDANGTIHMADFTVPFSSLASVEAKAAFIHEAQVRTTGPTPDWSDLDALAKSIRASRQAANPAADALVDAMKAVYPVDMSAHAIGSVYTQVFTPKEGIATRNKHRVLINLHGGGFIGGARTGSQLESAPIANVGRIKVVSVDYRLGPENKFPAASIDVAAVYRELLKEYKPQNIGIYGCSAGGMLTAEAIAWFDQEGLPLPGAIGIFCASTGPFSVGDSHYTSALLTGAPAVPSEEGGMGPTALYFGNADPKSPLVYPANSPALLAKFPATLFITATRAEEMSAAIHSHLQLLKAGVHSELCVWDGLSHAFLFDPNLPESREAFEIIVHFFDRNLGKKSGNSPRTRQTGR